MLSPFLACSTLTPHVARAVLSPFLILPFFPLPGPPPPLNRYAAMAITTPLGGAAADALLRRGTPLLAVRRRLHLVATLGPAVALIAATRATTPFAAAAAITAACAATSGGATGGFEAAFLDVASPGAVGTLKAVANTAASGAGMLAVPLTGALRGRWGWAALFGSLVPVQLASAVVFWRWGGVDRVTL